jgi:hypothetical protein
MLDPLAERIALLAPLAAQVDQTKDAEARQLLLAGMTLLVRSVAPPIQRAQIVPINGGKDQPEV